MVKKKKKKNQRILFPKNDLQTTDMRRLELERREVVSEPWKKTKR